MSELTLLTLPPSPYNTKVRLALRLKGIDFESVQVDFSDRTLVVERSGQPLTPVLIDRDRVVLDSHGIMRYLDANWPQAPRLFSADREQTRQIEEWERWARAEGAAGLGLVANQFFSGELDPQKDVEGQRLLEVALEKVEATLADQLYLMGDAPNAADLSVAPFLRYAAASADDFPPGTPIHFVASRLTLPERFPKTRAWLERIFAHDVEPARA